MTQITRTWLAFAAVGAGVIHLALVITAPLPAAVLLLLLGLAELLWAVLVLSKDRLVCPRLARTVSIIPVLLWSLLVAAAAAFSAPALESYLTLVPMLIASLLALFAGTVLSVALRATSTPEATAVTVVPSAGRYLVALTLGGLILGALVTPALSLTDAGHYAQPHGDHTATFVPRPAGDPLAGLVIPDHSRH